MVGISYGIEYPTVSYLLVVSLSWYNVDNMTRLENLLKSNKGGDGFFVGDEVCPPLLHHKLQKIDLCTPCIRQFMQPDKTYHCACFAWEKDADGKFYLGNRCQRQPSANHITIFVYEKD